MKKTTDDEAKPSAGIPEIKPEEENVEEAQTTPKASAATAPVLEVPVLDLDNNNNNHTPVQNGSAESASSSHTNNPHPPPRLTTDDKVARNESAMMPPPPLPSSQPAPSSPANSSSLMPPPPLPRLRATGQQTQQSQFLSPGPVPGRYPRPSTSNSLAPPPSAAASQRGPPSRLSPTGGSSSLAPPKQPSLKPSKNAPPSRRAALEPGFSPLDWAAKTSNPKENLRGANLPPTLIRVTPSMLKAQNGRKERDAWTSYQGKVFNITPYVPFHPGGKGELLRGAGKDSGKLFLEVHPWVNWDAILGECLVGILVSENEAEGENKLDAMD